MREFNVAIVNAFRFVKVKKLIDVDNRETIVVVDKYQNMKDLLQRLIELSDKRNMTVQFAVDGNDITFNIKERQ